MKKRNLFLFVGIFLQILIYGQQPTVTMKSELDRLLNINHLPSYIEGSVVKQVSSYDRKGGNNDGFEGTFSYIRRNVDSSLVIFESEGKGVIERIWTPTPTDDTLDFYFNGASSPSWSIKFNDLFSGKIYPFVNPVVGKKVGGWYSYLPIPFSNGCRVVFRGKKMLFFQLQCRLYEKGGPAGNFSPALDDDARATLEKTVSLWSKDKLEPLDLNESEMHLYSNKFTMKPGDITTMHNIRNPGRITSIALGNAVLYEGLSNNFDIRITWDDEKSPAVYAPVADFFGYAFGAASMKSLFAGVYNNTAYCNIPMPFDRNAKIELIYRKDSTAQPNLEIECTINVSSHKREAAREGKFYAYWKKESPQLGKPYVFLEGSGKGHYIGTILLSQGKDYEHFTEFFEGDDSTVLDNKHLLHGTGSEDYFNGGWYAQPGGWVERKGAPLHGCLDYSLPFSRTGGYRFYMLDKLPFSQQIYHSMEHGPVNNNRKVEYTSVAMYYADKPLINGEAPNNATAKIFIPDTLSFYSRLMNHLSYSGNARLIKGNAELDKNLDGTILIDVKELSKGSYKIFVHGKGTEQLSAGINDASVTALESGTQAEKEISTQKSKDLQQQNKTQKNKTQKPNKMQKQVAIQKQVEMQKQDEMQDKYIGTFELKDNSIPVQLNLKTGGDKLVLNRIFLVKRPKSDE
ncbi:glycoside hydrolase family 172 protein [Flavitalea sp.]|nr:glycoside hydrolase family 172 protein [Flavitalea sp.]